MLSHRAAASIPFAVFLFIAPAKAQSVQKLAAQTKNAVVALDHRTSVAGLLRRGTGENPLDSQSRTAGFLISAQGHIVTHARFVRGRDRMGIRLAGGAKAWATVLGVDTLNATAVLKLDDPKAVAARFGGKLPFLRWGSSSKLGIGQAVFTFGNTYDSLALDGQPALSRGVVTTISRVRQGSYKGVAIETDAAVNPGSFGGPLLDRKGRVVGLVTRGFSARRWLGTAVPADQVRLGAEAIIAKKPLTHGRLGVYLKTTGGEATHSGLTVTKVLANSAAARAGVSVGDRLLSLNSVTLYDTQDVAKELSELAPGSPVLLKVASPSGTKTLKAVLDPGGAAVSKRTVVRRPRPVRPRPRPRPVRPRTGKPASLGLRAEERDSGIGLLVLEVRPNGTAFRAGVLKGDILMRLGSAPLRRLNDLSSTLSRYREGDSVRLIIIRNRRARLLRLRFRGATALRPRPVPRPVPRPRTGRPGYLGVFLDTQSSRRGCLVEGTVKDSPAALGGLKKGDVVVRVDGRRVLNAKSFVDYLKTRRAGDRLAITVRRGFDLSVLSVTLGDRSGSKPSPKPTPKPTPSAAKVWLGVGLSEEGGRMVITSVDPRGPFAQAKLQKGDVIVKFDGANVSSLNRFGALLKSYRVGQTVSVQVERDGWSKTVSIRLAAKP